MKASKTGLITGIAAATLLLLSSQNLSAQPEKTKNKQNSYTITSIHQIPSPLMMKLFPKDPVNETSLPESISTSVTTPLSGLENSLINNTLAEFAQKSQIGARVPLLELGLRNRTINQGLPHIVGGNPEQEAQKRYSNETLNATLIAEGKLTPPYINKGKLGFSASLEFKITPPAVNALYSSNPDGSVNPLYFLFGVNQSGSLELNEIGNKTLQETYNKPPLELEDRSFFSGFEIVGNAPYGQYVLVKTTVDNILSKTSPLEVNLAGMMKFPPIPFTNIEPYISAKFTLPLSKDSEGIKGIGQAGLDLGNVVYLFAQAGYNPSSQKMEYFAGVKASPLSFEK